MHKKKMIAPIVITAIFVLYYIGFALLCVFVDGIPLFIKLLGCVIPLTANIIRSTLNGTSAFLARYGEDEFIIIIPQGEESTAVEVIQKIKDNIDAFNRTKQFPFQLSISAGYAISTKKADNRISMFKEADANMYRDKALYYNGCYN